MGKQDDTGYDGKMIQLRVFTLEEASSLIPQLTELVKKLRELRDAIELKEVEIDAVELVVGQGTEKGPTLVNAEVEKINQLIIEFNKTADQIHGMGCFLKDVDMGLVDFYTLLEGRVVYLCWKLGEEKIGYWHEVGKGYASRQPLNQPEVTE